MNGFATNGRLITGRLPAACPPPAPPRNPSASAAVGVSARLAARVTKAVTTVLFMDVLSPAPESGDSRNMRPDRGVVKYSRPEPCRRLGSSSPERHGGSYAYQTCCDSCFRPERPR